MQAGWISARSVERPRTRVGTACTDILYDRSDIRYNRHSMIAARTDMAAALFGRTRRNVLALLFGQPGRSFYLREIASRASTGMSQVQKELQQLVAAGLVLRKMIVPFKNRIRLAFIYGSIAKGSANASSDVDLLLVADLPPSEVSLPLARVQKQLGRKISLITYSSEEFASMLSGASFHQLRS